jgi:hypothetical protein
MLKKTIATIVRSSPRRRRASLWAGLYCGTFGVEDADDPDHDSEDATVDVVPN